MNRRLAWLTPLAAVAAAGCFATSNDIKILQSHIQYLQQTVETTRTDAEKARAAQAQRDSLMAAAIRAMTALQGNTRDSVRNLSDSIRVFMDAFSRFKADVALSDSQLHQTMFGMLAMLGASQKQIADLERGFELQKEQRTPVPGDTVSKGGMPGAAALYQTGMAQLQKASTSTARTAFEDLIQTYPDHRFVPDAIYQLAETYAREGNDGVADSLYRVVTTQYPKSQYASNALWKRAQALEKAGQPKAARALYNQIVTDYPGSEVFARAKDRVSKIPPQ